MEENSTEEPLADPQLPADLPEKTDNPIQPKPEEGTWFTKIFNPSIWGVTTLILFSAGLFGQNLGSTVIVSQVLAAALPFFLVISLFSAILFLSRRISSPSVSTIINSSLIGIPLLLCCASFMKPILQLTGTLIVAGLQCFGLSPEFLTNVALTNLLGGIALIIISVIIMAIAAKHFTKAEENTANEVADQPEANKPNATSPTITVTLDNFAALAKNPNIKIFAVEFKEEADKVIDLQQKSELEEKVPAIELS
jgi:hypothetical protein